MDQTRLDAIRARCEAATPGPWRAGRGDMATIVDGYESKWIYAGENNKYLAVASGYEVNDWNEVMDNARFIAHARTDVPALLAEIARLTAALKLLESDRDAERKIRLDAEADRDTWRRRAEAAEADLNHIAQEMFSDNSEDLRGEWYPCEVCRKYDGGKDCLDCLAASYDESKPGTAFEWRGPEEDKPC